MIISASRRSDIPAFYFDWFLERLRAGTVLTRNPMNPRQVSRVSLKPEDVDGIVFWSKNPKPLLRRLPDLAAWPFYVQFTITPYGRDLEGDLPDKNALTDTFKRLADKLGPERMVWRYSPIIVNAAYPENRHVEFFARLAERLRGRTRKCNLAFLDIYAKIRKNMARLNIADIPEADKTRLAKRLAAIATDNGIAPGACGTLDAGGSGIPPAHCVDANLIGRLSGRPQSAKKDPGQRPTCSCARSVDIGAYNTCPHACSYCYANFAPETAAQRLAAHDPQSPLLCDSLRPGDVVTDRKEAGTSLSKRQKNVFETIIRIAIRCITGEYAIYCNAIREEDLMAQINIRLDDSLKTRADELFAELGLNMTTAFNIFIRQVIRHGGIPFEITVDPFYHPENMRVLEKSVRDADAGRVVVHELNPHHHIKKEK